MLSFFTRAQSQQETSLHQNMMAKLRERYNTASYESIFLMFSKEMARALPLQQTVSFFSDLKRDAGNLETYSFRGFEEVYASYAARFSRTQLLWLVSIDKKGKVSGLQIKPFTTEAIPLLEKNISGLCLPFKGPWTVVWGGTTREQNYHVDVPAQRYAFDFVATDDSGKSFKTDGTSNEDYYAFGKDIIAPCDGEVVMMVDGIPDNSPGKMNTMFVTGNTVILKTQHNEYLVFAHFKKHSITVREGQAVNKGALLGLCGNSGNSSEPHLHFHIQDRADLNTALGVACDFESIRANGTIKKNHLPVKGENVENE